MKITLFTSNQPRHLNLANLLSKIADEVFVVSEVNTVFPGKVSDFYKKSDVMKGYFEKVISAERKAFGDIDFLSKNVRTIALKSGDLNLLSEAQLASALNSDVYVVFGASYIKGWLIDFLVERQALNIHMGISPYYRGSSCNFWALFDDKPSHVGATIHMLSKGLDSGDMIFHCVPKYIEGDSPFDFTMRSVAAAHFGLTEGIKNGDLLRRPRVPQTKKLEVRYTKHVDFTEAIVSEFLGRNYEIDAGKLKYPELLDPIFY
jgi:methionyl-tRNA formyltransferase